VRILPGRPGAPGAAGLRAGGAGRREPLVSAAAYVMLFVLGGCEAVVGCFFYAAGPAPAAALAFALAIFSTCLLGGWGMFAPSGALAPAAGWFLAAFVLASATGSGSVIITNTAAGKWFLYGGAAAVIAAVIAAFTAFARAARLRR
jgi:hypothetical protein